MRDAELRRVTWASIAHQQRLFGLHAIGGRVVEDATFVASIVPSAPDASMLNAAVPLDPDSPPPLAQLSAAFDGTSARWGVWVDAGGRALERDLLLGGLRVEGVWRLMGARLEQVEAGDDERVAEADPRTIGAVNDLAYGLMDGRLERHFGSMPPDAVHGYRIDLGPGPAAVAAVIDHGSDAGVLFVATIAPARRRGLAAALMRKALTDARRRGQETTSLLATAAGAPLYERLGYHDLGEARLWSRGGGAG